MDKYKLKIDIPCIDDIEVEGGYLVGISNNGRAEMTFDIGLVPELIKVGIIELVEEKEYTKSEVIEFGIHAIKSLRHIEDKDIPKYANEIFAERKIIPKPISYKSTFDSVTERNKQ